MTNSKNCIVTFFDEAQVAFCKNLEALGSENHQIDWERIQDDDEALERGTTKRSRRTCTNTSMLCNIAVNLHRFNWWYEELRNDFGRSS